MKSNYGLYVRYVNDKKIWYFWYYLAGKKVYKSTRKTTKREAKEFVDNFMQSLRQDHKADKSSKSSMTLKEFTANFFIWDKCDWIKSQHVKGKPFAISMAKMRRGQLDNYILPEFGNICFKDILEENCKLNAVDVEKWLSNLPLANQTKNHILYTFKIIMKWAKKKRFIRYNALADTEPASRNDYKKKDILSIEELKILFPADQEALIAVWGSTFYATLFLLMVTSGMRSQEIRALVWGDLLVTEGILFIEHAVKRHEEMGSTKSDYEKAVYLPDRTITMLLRWKNETPFNDKHHLIFYGSSEDKPIHRGKMLEVIRKVVTIPGKHITPHCLRTTYNSYMRRHIPEKLLRLQLGHKSEAMTNRYDRSDIMEKLQPFQEQRGKITDFWDKNLYQLPETPLKK